MFFLIRTIFKHLLMFIVFGIIGIFVLFRYFIDSLINEAVGKTGLAVIAVAPVLTVVYSVFSFVIGGLIGMGVLYLVKILWKLITIGK